MKIKKLIAFLLSAVMLISFAGCKVKDDPRPSNYVITEDDPWYIRTDIDLEKMIDAEDFYGSEMEIEVIDDQLLLMLGGNENRGDFAPGIRLGLMRMSGMMSVDTTLVTGDDVKNVRALGGCRIDSNKIAVIYTVTMNSDNTPRLYRAIWDTSSNTISEPEEISIDLNENSYIFFNGQAGDYTVIQDIPIVYDEEEFTGGGSTIWILDKGEPVKRIDLKDTSCPSFNISYVSMVDGKLMIYGSDYTGFYNLNAVVVEGNYLFEYDPLSDNLNIDSGYRYNYAEQIKTIGEHGYSIRQDGIYMDGELYLSFIDYGIEVESLDMPEIAYVDSERVILIQKEKDFYYSNINVIYGNRVPQMIKLEKAPQNPNAGKRVINALSISYPENYIIKGIQKYNSEANDCFIKCRVEDINNYTTVEAASRRFDELEALLTSEDGPDIVFNAYMLPELNDDLFMDLKRKVKLSKREFFTNISEVCQINGKQYFVPLTYSVEGIFVRTDDLDKDQIGFTYGQYESQVVGKWNGQDPLAYFGSEFFYKNRCLPSACQTLNKKGIPDVDQEGFRQALTFIKKNAPLSDEMGLPEIGDNSLVVIPDVSYEEASYAYCSSYRDYSSIAASMGIISSVTFCGVPSYRGAGPSAYINSSVSVCAKSGMKRSCVDFIGSLLEPAALLNSDYFTISKEAESIKLSSTYQRDFSIGGIEKASEMYILNIDSDGYVAVNEDSQTSMVDLVENLESVKYVNYLFNRIVYERSEPLMRGTADLDQTVADINGDIEKYIGH